MKGNLPAEKGDAIVCRNKRPDRQRPAPPEERSIVSPICPITVQPARREDLQVLPGWFSTEAELIQWGGPQLSFPLDAPQLAAMWAEYSDTPPRRLIWSGHGAGTGIVAHAQAVLNWPERTARLARIGLAPALRGQGLAQDFLAAVIAQLAELEDFTRLELNVYSFNQPAIRLYERLGFTTEDIAPATAAAAKHGWEVMRMARPLP